MTFLPSPRTPTSRIARMEPPMICCMGNDVMRGNHAIQPPYTDGSKRPPFLLCLRNYTPESAPASLSSSAQTSMTMGTGRRKGGVGVAPISLGATGGGGRREGKKATVDFLSSPSSSSTPAFHYHPRSYFTEEGISLLFGAKKNLEVSLLSSKGPHGLL